MTIETKDYMADWDVDRRVLRVLHIESGVFHVFSESVVERVTDGESLCTFLCNPRRTNAVLHRLYNDDGADEK